MLDNIKRAVRVVVLNATGQTSTSGSEPHLKYARPTTKGAIMEETNYEAGYRRAIDGVKTAIRQGLITVPDPSEEGEDEVVLRVAEHFMVSLGVNEP